MIQFDNLTLSFSKKTIFNCISARIGFDQKIGIVGPNGAGKSTLLKAIAGQQKLDGGRIVTPPGATIAYLPQEVTLQSTRAVFDETMAALPVIGPLHIREKELVAADLVATEEYVHIHGQLGELSYHERVREATEVLNGLGFTTDRFATPVSELSVGWQMRVVLAQLLLQKADFYLFDEPTNHLDLPAQEWFCEFLQKSKTGYAIISHDRYLLDTACEQIFALSLGRGELFNGNYTHFLAQKEIHDQQVRLAAAQQQKEIAQKKKVIERFKAKANKAKMAKSMAKQLERIELIEAEPEAGQIAISFPPIERAGKVVVTTHDLAFGYESDKILFAGANLSINRGEKVAIVAPNGAGKTTLFNCITGKLKPTSGRVSFGYKVSYAYFEQEQIRVLDRQATILDEVEGVCDATMRPKVRGLLGAFLFSGTDVDKKIKVLSGGERNRVAMVKVLCQNANLLFLDEPTNHLDLRSKEVLLQALRAYEGTIIFVSHDRDFVSKLATAIISLDDKKITYYPGEYESFKYAHDAARAHASAESVSQHTQTKAVPSASKEEQKKNREQSKRIALLERQISELEDKKKYLIEQLGLYEYGSDDYTVTLNKFETCSQELEKKMRDWESALL